MANRNIIKLGDETLRKKSKHVEEFDAKLGVLLDDMKETLKKNDGVGLAAPQVGILKRVVVVYDTEHKKFIELINPSVYKAGGVQHDIEGCLSIPGKFGITVRPRKVTVTAQDRHGVEFKVTGSDLLARALCHEIDHLNGVLFIDHVERMLSPEELKGDKK